MPYKRIEGLPDKIKFNLPKPAQKIFIEKYNSHWNKYKSSKKRKELATKIAYSEVKKNYNNFLVELNKKEVLT